MANANNKVYYNRGYLFRKKDDPVGVSGECNTLELYVYDVKDKTTRTGDEIIELSCSGNFNKNNGIDYVLGDDVYADKEKGLLFITCSAWDIKKDRSILVRTILRVYLLYVRILRILMFLNSLMMVRLRLLHLQLSLHRKHLLQHLQLLQWMHL